MQVPPPSRLVHESGRARRLPEQLVDPVRGVIELGDVEEAGELVDRDDDAVDLLVERCVPRIVPPDEDAGDVALDIGAVAAARPFDHVDEFDGAPRSRDRTGDIL